MGFQPEGDGSHTYALRSINVGQLKPSSIEEAALIAFQGLGLPCEHVTIRPLDGAISTLVTVLSCPFSSSCSVKLLPERL